MGGKRGQMIREIAYDLNLDRYGGIREGRNTQEAVKYGEAAASRYMKGIRKQNQRIRSECVAD